MFPMIRQATLGLVAAVAIACTTPLRAPAKAAATAQERRALVELWSGGDDGYTQRFAVSLDVALMESTVFRSVQAHDDQAMRLTIETNLRPIDIGDNPRAEYVVSLATAAGMRLGTMRGNCRGSEFDKCAKTVLKRAERLLLAREGSE